MNRSHIAIIGAPLDLGAGRRGVDMGPSAMRVANINKRIATLGYDVEDLGNVPVEQPESLPEGPRHAKYLPQIAATCQRLAADGRASRRGGKAPLVMGGDHSIAIGSVAGVARHFRKKKKRIGLIWIDAHADMNTPQTSPSGNVHGMPLACCIGLGPEELDEAARLLAQGASAQRRAGGIARRGHSGAAARARERRAGLYHARYRRARFARGDGTGARYRDRRHRRFSRSLDMDYVDPQYAPGVGTPVRGGATYREAHLAMEMICDSGHMASMDVVEVNPVIDEVNRTADLAVELVMSALGKKIL